MLVYNRVPSVLIEWEEEEKRDNNNKRDINDDAMQCTKTCCQMLIFWKLMYSTLFISCSSSGTSLRACCASLSATRDEDKRYQRPPANPILRASYYTVLQCHSLQPKLEEQWNIGLVGWQCMEPIAHHHLEQYITAFFSRGEKHDTGANSASFIQSINGHYLIIAQSRVR